MHFKMSKNAQSFSRTLSVPLARTVRRIRINLNSSLMCIIAVL